MMKKCTRITALLLLPLILSAVLFLPSCGNRPDPGSVDEFLSLTVSQGGKITATVRLSQATYDAHREDRLCLYATGAGGVVSAVTPVLSKPLDTASADGTVTLSADLTDGDVTYLYSGFCVGFEDEPPLFLPKYLSNPDVLAASPIPYRWAGSPKALNVTDPVRAAELNTSHANVTLSVSDLLAADEVFTFNATRVVYSRGVEARLDRLIGESYSAGMQVSLDLRMDANLSPLESAAFLDRITSRYSDPENGALTGIFLTAPAGTDPAEAARFLRTADLALRSHTGGGRVWLVTEEQSLTAIKTFFDAVRSELAGGGAFAWGAGVCPDCGNAETAPWDVTDPEILQFHTLPTLVSYLTNAEGSANPSCFAVTRLEFSASNVDRQAASLAYAYRASAAAHIDFICYRAESGADSGLLTPDMTPRRAAGIFSRLDTGLSAEDESLVASYAGAAFTSLPSPEPTRSEVSGALNFLADQSDFATWYAFSEDLNGFSAFGARKDPALIPSASLDRNVLSAVLSSAGSGGVRKVLSDAKDLEGVLSVTLRVLLQLPDDANAADLRLRIDGTAKDGTLLTYEASAPVDGEHWENFTFAIGSFVSAADLSAPAVLTVLADAESPSGTDYALLIDSIRVNRSDGGRELLLPFALIGGGLAVGFLITFVCFLISTEKKKRRARKGEK